MAKKKTVQSVEPNIADLVNGWLKSYKLDYKLEQKSIAKACNLSVTTVRRALADLENGGWINIAQRFTDNGQESNLYKVLNI